MQPSPRLSSQRSHPVIFCGSLPPARSVFRLFLQYFQREMFIADDVTLKREEGILLALINNTRGAPVREADPFARFWGPEAFVVVPMRHTREREGSKKEKKTAGAERAQKGEGRV